MVDLDPIDERVQDGLARTETSLEAYAAELAGSLPSETTPETPGRVDDPLGRAAAELVGGILRSSVQAFLERPRQPRRWRFTSPPQAAVPAPSPPPATAAPAPVVATVESGKPNLEIPGPGLDFVGFVNDRPQARESARFPKEFLEAHEQRLDINRSELVVRPKMRGPVIGSQ